MKIQEGGEETTSPPNLTKLAKFAPKNRDNLDEELIKFAW